jgi:hypothetical protein
MGPCATCGQLTEPDAHFCPACSGYAAPATVYSYSPSRLSRSDGELAQILDPLLPPHAPLRDDRLDGPAEAWQAPEPVPATRATRSLSRNRGTRRRAADGRRHEGRWLIASVTVIVLIIAAWAALAQLGRAGHASPPAVRPTVRTSAPAASPAAPLTQGPQVSVAPLAASSPYETTVLSFLVSYFTAINTHDFTAYQQLFDPQLRAAESATAFSAGYGTTTDSAIALTSIGVIGIGELVAEVTFVSHQQPAASPTNSACTAWTVSLYLLQHNGSYELQQPTAGYHASFTACA